jgi:hypothetical protein
MSRSPVPLKNPAKAALLAWLVPGLGHFYQGRKGKGILYAVCIIGLYTLGLILGDGKVVYWTWINPLANSEKFRLTFLFQVPFGLPALLAFLQSILKWFGEQPILWGFLAEPPQNAINGVQRFGKIVEIAWVYTTVAGLLNVLAIYDAYDGPAHFDLADEEETAGVAEAGSGGNGTLGNLKVEGRAR